MRVAFKKLTGMFLLAGVAALGLSSAIAADVASFSIKADGGGDIGVQTYGVPFYVTITALDDQGQVVDTFNDSIDLYSSAGNVYGTGTTASFSNGVLSSHQITFYDAGGFYLLALDTNNH